MHISKAILSLTINDRISVTQTTLILFIMIVMHICIKLPTNQPCVPEVFLAFF